uniref:Beta-microseminoprotein n=1 Tax=Varanus komodoensis TaxID=61221 RepID=A0A8D2KTS3_VARKO
MQRYPGQARFRLGSPGEAPSLHCPPPPPVPGCFHDGQWHRVAAVWKASTCLRCECKATELICCSLVSRPINYDKRVCVAMFHRQSCSIRVVKKTNPAESCQVFAGVG